MEEVKKKYNLPVITAEMFNLSPERYEIRKGTLPDAPPCPFGNQFKWIGYDNMKKEYVRVTKSVFKKLINQIDAAIVAQHELDFDEDHD
jgi:hypothetical protein